MAPKRALILTYGSRGDVEPFIALAKGLQAAGNEVLLATASRFGGFVEGFGVPFFALPDESLAAIESPDGKLMLEGGGGMWRRILAGIRRSRRSGPINDALMRECWTAAESFAPDVIVFHPKAFGAPHIAEALKVPAFLGLLQPMIVPTSAFPPLGLPRLPLPALTRLSYRLVRLSFGLFRGNVNRFRKDSLGLPPIRGGGEAVLFPRGRGSIPVLHGYSRHVLPPPPDWPDWAHVTGHWRLKKDRSYTLPTELADFLDRGPPPVFIGFGSMTSVDPTALGRLVTRALRRAGQRGIVARGWAGLEIGADETGRGDILSIPPAPYDWLFPRMAAVVHHGGAGTTAEGFHAGVPSVVCPFFGDQPGWARLSVELGVGAAPVPRNELTEERLADAIQEAVSSPSLRRNAAGLAARLNAEDGVQNAIRCIAEAFRNPGRQP